MGTAAGGKQELQPIQTYPGDGQPHPTESCDLHIATNRGFVKGDGGNGEEEIKTKTPLLSGLAVFQ